MMMLDRQLGIDHLDPIRITEYLPPKQSKRARKLRYDRKGGPLLEEGILIGIGLFAFLILASIVTDIIQWLIGNFSDAGDTLGGLIGG